VALPRGTTKARANNARAKYGKGSAPCGLGSTKWRTPHTKETSLSALYHRLAVRREKKQAVVAVAHTIVRNAFHILSRHEVYHELGVNYFDVRRQTHLVDRLTRRLEPLDYRVGLALFLATWQGDFQRRIVGGRYKSYGWGQIGLLPPLL
jgi:hypothetical protein